jgi:hypothetical protein
LLAEDYDEHHIYPPDPPLNEGAPMNIQNDAVLGAGASGGLGSAFVEALLAGGAGKVDAPARGVDLSEAAAH